MNQPRCLTALVLRSHACVLIQDLDSHLEVCVPRPAMQSIVYKKLANFRISRCQEGWVREELAARDVSAGHSHSAPSIRTCVYHCVQ